MAKTILVRSIQEAINDVNKKIVLAGKNTVNRVAFIARKNAQTNIQKNFTLRNNFTQKGVTVTQCKNAKTLSDVRAVFGAEQRIEYMARQETGGTKRSPTGANLIIPNTRARVSKSNEKQVKRNFRYTNVKANTIHSFRAGSHKANLVARAFIASSEKDKFIRVKNSFYQIRKFKKNGKSVKFEKQQILNLEHESTYTPQRQWLEPASDFAKNLMQNIFNQEMEKL